MKARIRPRLDQWSRLMELAHITSDQALARRMDIDPSTVSRTLRQGGEVSATFIAAALDTFTGFTFETLFAIDSGHRKPLAGGSDSAPRPQGPRPR